MRICGVFFAAKRGFFSVRKVALMGKEEIKHTELCVKERGRIVLNGVINIESFESSYVTLETSEGRISIEGEGLKIEDLCSTNGEIRISGKINGVFYSKEKKARGGLARLFG